MNCPLCGPSDSLAPDIILKRNRTELFAVSGDGKLMPVCLDCAERMAPET